MRQPNPLALSFDICMLGVDAWTVIALRIPRLLKGDTAAINEAQRMVGEKVEAAVVIYWKSLTGTLGTDGPSVFAASLAHYHIAVRRNKRRLAR